MADADVSAYLEKLVDKKLREALSPHLEALERLSAFLGTRRGPGRPAAKARDGARRGPGRPPGRGRAAAAMRGDASKFREGQKVRYRQGRGEFEASVVNVDLANQAVTVERASDGKRVIRPAAKLYEA